MSKTRLHLFMFGIISVFLLSSFSIWRIFLDVSTVRSQQNRIDTLYHAQLAVAEMITTVQEIRALSGSWILLPENDQNASRFSELISNRKFLTGFRWDDKYQPRVKNIVARIDSMMQILTEDIAGNLLTIDDYEVPVKHLLAEAGLEQIDAQANTALDSLYILYDEIHSEQISLKERLSTRSNRGITILVVLEVLMFLAGLIGLIILLTSPAWKKRHETF